MNDDYLGEISSKPGRKKISQSRWIEMVADHANLAPVPAREGINPFTKERIILKPRPGIAQVVVDGQEVGSMEWSDGESSLINVFGEADVVIPLADEIAQSLGGRFEVAASSE